MEKNLTLAPPSAKTTIKIHGLVLFIFIYIIGNLYFPRLERYIFWGELCSLLAFYLFLKETIVCNRYQRIFVMLVLIWLFLMPVYALLISWLFWSDQIIPVMIFRHAVIFYYSIFFFLSFQYAHEFIGFLEKNKYLLFVLLLVMKSNVGIILAVLLIILAKAESRAKFYYGFYLFAMIKISLLGHGTYKFILLVYLGVPLLFFLARFWSKSISIHLRRFSLYCVGLFAVVLFGWAMNYVYNIVLRMAAMGLTIADLTTLAQQIGTDPNGLWRLILWSNVLGRVWENPLGLGIGTPLFSYWLDGFMALHSHDTYEFYVQGAHNSFVTFIGRLGIPGFIVVLALFVGILRLANLVFQQFHFNHFETGEERRFIAIFLALGSIAVIATFNVTLESPITAGTFWFFLGLCVRVFGDFLESRRHLIHG